VTEPNEDPPFEGGSQPVPQRPPGVPGPGRSTAQVVVLVIAALVIVAVLIWIFVPIGAG
jgi:hypothetical protein